MYFSILCMKHKNTKTGYLHAVLLKLSVIWSTYFIGRLGRDCRYIYVVPWIVTKSLTPFLNRGKEKSTFVCYTLSSLLSFQFKRVTGNARQQRKLKNKSGALWYMLTRLRGWHNWVYVGNIGRRVLGAIVLYPMLKWWCSVHWKEVYREEMNVGEKKRPETSNTRRWL